MSAADYNPLSPEALADPYPFFARAHRESPVFFSPRFNLWIVTRFADIWTALRDPATFCSAISTTVGTAVPPEVDAILAEGWGEIPTLVTSDPPAHTRFRSLVNKAFTPRRVAERTDRIREIASGLVDGVHISTVHPRAQCAPTAPVPFGNGIARHCTRRREIARRVQVVT